MHVCYIIIIIIHLIIIVSHVAAKTYSLNEEIELSHVQRLTKISINIIKQNNSDALPGTVLSLVGKLNTPFQSSGSRDPRNTTDKHAETKFTIQARLKR